MRRPARHLLLTAFLAALLPACDEPTEPELPVERLFRTVSAGNGTCAVTRDGAVYCGWADPVAVEGIDGTVESVSVGWSHICALTGAGRAYCWGSNDSGALGDGTTESRYEPGPVSGAETFESLGAGSGHSCGLATDGTAYCWGYNAAGQVGDGTTEDRLVPVPVATSERFARLAVGARHTCGITTGGETLCWGQNLHGEVGDGTSGEGEHRLVPTPVQTAEAFVSVAAGGLYTCALTDAGRAWCWGWNDHGRLGDGTTENRTRPVPVAGSVVFDSIDTFDHTCGLSEEGLAYCWGANEYGQLGVGTVEPATEPKRVATDERFAGVSAGHAYSCAVTPGGVRYCWGDIEHGGFHGWLIPVPMWR